MAKLPIAVRRVDAEHRGDFFELWVAGRVEAGHTRESAQRVALDGRLTASLDARGITAYIAYLGGEAVGYAVTSDPAAVVLIEAPAVTIEHLYVRATARRHGVGKALLTAIATRAERAGADVVAVNVPSQGRDANRFFARIGFTPHVVRRTASTAGLLRRLAGAEAGQGVEQILLRRRLARLRAGRTHLAG